MKNDTDSAFKSIRHAARSFEEKLVQIRKEFPAVPRFEIKFAEVEDPKRPEGTSARLVIVIIADTAEHAYEHAQDLVDDGCVCTSSGETEVTCDCSSHQD